MKTFFTSDLHLQSTESPGIIEWAHRPFKSVEKHDAALIRGIQERVKPDDLLIHVGDFMNYGKNRGREGGRAKPEEYIKRIGRQIVFLEGNHDPNNHVRCIGRTLTTKVGRYIVSVGHYPSWDERFESVATHSYIDGNADWGDATSYQTVPHFRIHLCGHVHDKWKYQWDEISDKYKILNINVGVDAWKYRPVSEAELDAYIGKVLAGKEG